MAITRRKALCGGFVSLVLIALLVVAIELVAHPGESPGASDETGALLTQEQQNGEETQIAVKTIRPRRDPAFVISVQEPAYVKAYYQAELMAQLAGRVKFIQKDIGDPVTQGEVLVEIDVPDLAQEVALKEALVQRGKREEELTERKIEVAQAAVEVADDDIELKKALLAQADATRDLRLKRWNRFKGAAQSNVVDVGIVEEEERDYWAAKGASDAARASIKKAEADCKETRASLGAVIADVKLKQALVEVARKGRDHAQAQADYGKITAPFDGVIVRREVDPGSFVQNATTAHTEPLLTLARTDIVTVYAKVPDNFAPLVTKQTEVIIQMDSLPGAVIKGKVTRFTPSVENKDRRMRVEVDLFNGSEQEYRRSLLKALATHFAPLGVPRIGEATTLAAAARTVWRQSIKGVDTFPLFPEVTGENAGPPASNRLLPGMTGYMRLLLPSDNSYLVPSGAVFSRGGKRYLLEVKDGTAHLVDVEVQADDGYLAKVVKVLRQMNAKTGTKERLRLGLTGNEEIIAGGQGEIADGQAVKATLVDWQHD